MIMLRSATIGDLTLGSMPAVVYHQRRDDGQANAVPAQVGIQLCTGFRTIVDYGSNRLSLVNAALGSPHAIRKDRAGLSLAPHADHLEVVHVRRGSPAERK